MKFRIGIGFLGLITKLLFFCFQCLNHTNGPVSETWCGPKLGLSPRSSMGQHSPQDRPSSLGFSPFLIPAPPQK